MDISTQWDAALGRGDWTIAPQARFVTDGFGNPMIGPDGFAVPIVAGPQMTGLASGKDVETAVLISIFTDAAVGPDDVGPDGTLDPRGWWGDPAIGSKLWLLARARRTPQTLQLAIAYLRDALGWLVTDGVALSIEIAAEWQAGGRLAGSVTVNQPRGNAVVPFDYAWKDLA